MWDLIISECKIPGRKTGRQEGRQERRGRREEICQGRQADRQEGRQEEGKKSIKEGRASRGRREGHQGRDFKGGRQGKNGGFQVESEGRPSRLLLLYTKEKRKRDGGVEGERRGGGRPQRGEGRKGEKVQPCAA